MKQCTVHKHRRWRIWMQVNNMRDHILELLQASISKLLIISSVNCNDVRGELQQHGGHCKLIQHISTNIWSLGTYRDPKLGEIYFLPSISCNITISWLHPLNSSWFIFSLHDSENHLLSLANKVLGKRLLIGSLMRRQILQHQLLKN